MSQKKLRILDLRDSPWVDGPGRTILQSASMVDPARCEIIIGAFCDESHDQHAYLNEAKSLGLKTLEIKESSAFDRKVIKQIQNEIKKNAIDIIHTHDFRSDLFGLWCAKKSKIYLISTCHGWIANNFKRKIFTILDKFMLRFFDRVITVSEVMRKHLITRGINKNKINVIVNALILDDFQPDKCNQTFRKQLKISDNTCLIVNIGRLSPEKGQDIFIRSAKELLKIYEDICFVLVGIGPEQEYLQGIVSELGINNSVIFSGYQKNMLDVYNSSDLVVQSSYTEGMPNVVLESLLMQLPVIATDVGGTSEVLQHNETGTLIEANNLDQLTDAIKEYIEQPEKYEKMASAGRKYVTENFDHNQRVDSLMDVYELVTNNSMQVN